MFRTENLSIHICQTRWFKNLNLEFKPGTITVITGPNGIGKTTLLNHLAGIRKVTQGSIYLDSENLASLGLPGRAKQIASLGQHDTAHSDTLVFHRISHGLLEHDSTAIREIAEELELTDLLGRRLKQLSGGERKRVHIARCLVQKKAQVYILDEPDAGLDAHGKTLLEHAIKRLSDAKKTVLLTSHTTHLTSHFNTLHLSKLC